MTMRRIRRYRGPERSFRLEVSTTDNGRVIQSECTETTGAETEDESDDNEDGSRKCVQTRRVFTFDQANEFRSFLDEQVEQIVKRPI
jgi:hypothetical protein